MSDARLTRALGFEKDAGQESGDMPTPGPTPGTGAKNPRPKRSRSTQGQALILDDTEPADGQVEGPALFAEVALTLSHYMVLSPHVAVTLSLWVALTYLTDAVEVLPRLLISSPTLACGKTRLFSLIGALVRRPVPATSVSPAALFRIIEATSPTLLLDEVDNARLDDNPDLRALLNSGHSRTSAWTLRCVGESLEARRFSTWAPVAFACIGKLPDTVTSRCIPCAMRRRSADEPVARLRESRIKDELKPLRRRLARWCQDHAGSISEADPSPPDGLSDRDGDNWTPLLAIADAIGGDWPAKVLAAARALSGATATADDSADVLADMKLVFGEADRISTADALQALVALEERPWCEWRHGRPLTPRGLAGLLKRYGITSGTVRFDDTITRKGYLRESFEDAWKRYTPFSGDLIRNSDTDRENSGPNDENRNRRVTDEKRVLTAPDAAGDAVTDGKPPEGSPPCRFCGGRVIRWGTDPICSGCHRHQEHGVPLSGWEPAGATAEVAS